MDGTPGVAAKIGGVHAVVDHARMQRRNDVNPRGMEAFGYRDLFKVGQYNIYLGRVERVLQV